LEEASSYPKRFDQEGKGRGVSGHGSKKTKKHSRKLASQLRQSKKGKKGQSEPEKTGEEPRRERRGGGGMDHNIYVRKALTIKREEREGENNRIDVPKNKKQPGAQQRSGLFGGKR